MNKHRQVAAIYKGRRIDVDAGIAPLLRGLWMLGINTVVSSQCQTDFRGSGDRVWIEFEELKDLESFIRIVTDALWPISARPGEDALISRLNSSWHDKAWCYSIDACDAEHLEGAASDWSTPPFMMFSQSVRFPCSDYPVVLKAIQQKVKYMKQYKRNQKIAITL